jgi:hypothetical protein
MKLAQVGGYLNIEHAEQERAWLAYVTIERYPFVCVIFDTLSQGAFHT